MGRIWLHNTPKSFQNPQKSVTSCQLVCTLQLGSGWVEFDGVRSGQVGSGKIAGLWAILNVQTLWSDTIKSEKQSHDQFYSQIILQNLAIWETDQALSKTRQTTISIRYYLCLRVIIGRMVQKPIGLSSGISHKLWLLNAIVGSNERHFARHQIKLAHPTIQEREQVWEPPEIATEVDQDRTGTFHAIVDEAKLII